MTENSRERDAVWNHPVLQELLQQHEDCSPASASRAFQVYLNLAEVRGWRDVRIHYCEDLQSPFVAGRGSLGSILEAAYPVSVHDAMSHCQIQSLFTALRVGDQRFDRIMLAFCAPDSSIVYYNVSNTIVKPELPETSDARKQEWNQKAAKRKRHVAECIEHFSQTQRDTQSENAP